MARRNPRVYVQTLVLRKLPTAYCCPALVAQCVTTSLREGRLCTQGYSHGVVDRHSHIRRDLLHVSGRGALYGQEGRQRVRPAVAFSKFAKLALLILTTRTMQAQTFDGRNVGVLLLVHVRTDQRLIEIDRCIPPLILNEHIAVVNAFSCVTSVFAAGGLSCTGRSCTPYLIQVRAWLTPLHSLTGSVNGSKLVLVFFRRLLASVI